MALGHPEPTTLFQEASVHSPLLWDSQPGLLGLRGLPKHRYPPKQVEATWRYPPYKRKSMSPTLGASGFSAPSQERWQRGAGGDFTVNKCNQVPAALDLPCHLPTQPQFSYLS